MNPRRNLIATLAAAAAFAGTLAALPARSATPPTPGQLAIYVRGWIDGAAPPGVYVVHAACSSRHVCVVKLSDGSCARATVTGYAFPGPWHHCTKAKEPTS